jgi:hypothetical protein
MEISWSDRVEIEVLHSVNKERNILHTVNRGRAGGIGHIVLWDCVLKRDIEGKTEEKSYGTKRKT